MARPKSKVEGLDPKKPSFVKNDTMKRDNSLQTRKKHSQAKARGGKK